ncbi:MAG: NAD(P)-binding domain-containing protein [Deltaproteobacteria bacterium]|nr:NAD(P)-binding domain-containing protein [Deltaproteobacteria bacterium]
MKPVGIVGAGAFGKGLARAARRAGNSVVLFSRFPQELGDAGIEVVDDLAALTRSAPIFIAVPSIFVGEVGRELGAHLDGRHLLVHVSRGLVGAELRTLSRVLREVSPVRRVGALAGPLDAAALAEGLPGGAIVGSAFPEVAAAVRAAIGGSSLRIYESSDSLGVEVASAIVGLAAIAVGYARAVGAGPSALAVMVTRAMHEAAAVGTELGAKRETFWGLAGLGDLVAATLGDGRPELAVGEALGQGKDVEAAAKIAGANVESLGLAGRMADYAQRVSVPAPVTSTVARVIAGELDTQHALAALMARDVGKE